MTNKKVYVIDDEIDILDAINIILSEAGFEVTTSTSFTSVNQILKVNPDIILLDLLLIGTNGKDVCSQIRRHWLGKLIPIILVSAHPENKLQAYVKQCHANGFLQKPFDIEVLVNTVKKHLA